MVRLQQVPFIRVVGEAALEQKEYSPGNDDGVAQWIQRIEQQRAVRIDEQAIRQASEVLIRRLRLQRSTT